MDLVSLFVGVVAGVGVMAFIQGSARNEDLIRLRAVVRKLTIENRRLRDRLEEV